MQELAANKPRNRVQTPYNRKSDGHGGPLLSIAMVREDGYGMHVSTTADAHDPWVIANVLPLMGRHRAELHATVGPNEVGHWLRAFLSETPHPIIIADSPVDIGRFCAALSTDKDGSWASTGYPQITFEVHNVDCYPTDLEGAVQHNAYWDAMALRAKLAQAVITAHESVLVEENERLREALREISGGQITCADGSARDMTAFRMKLVARAALEQGK